MRAKKGRPFERPRVSVEVAIANSEAEKRSHLNHAGIAPEHAIELSEIRVARSQIAGRVRQSAAGIDVVDLARRVLGMVERVAEVGAETQLPALREVHLLRKRDVPVVDALCRQGVL